MQKSTIVTMLKPEAQSPSSSASITSTSSAAMARAAIVSGGAGIAPVSVSSIPSFAVAGVNPNGTPIFVAAHNAQQPIMQQQVNGNTMAAAVAPAPPKRIQLLTTPPPPINDLLNSTLNNLQPVRPSSFTSVTSELTNTPPVSPVMNVRPASDVPHNSIIAEALKEAADRLLTDCSGDPEAGHCDVSVVSPNSGFSVNAHKLVLAAGSGYFERIFKEAEQTAHHEEFDHCGHGRVVVVISDINPDILRSIISYIYTGSVTLESAEEYAEFFKAAKSLELKCEMEEKQQQPQRRPSSDGLDFLAALAASKRHLPVTAPPSFSSNNGPKRKKSTPRRVLSTTETLPLVETVASSTRLLPMATSSTPLLTTVQQSTTAPAAAVLGQQPSDFKIPKMEFPGIASLLPNSTATSGVTQISSVNGVLQPNLMFGNLNFVTNVLGAANKINGSGLSINPPDLSAFLPKLGPIAGVSTAIAAPGQQATASGSNGEVAINLSLKPDDIASKAMASGTADLTMVNGGIALTSTSNGGKKKTSKSKKNAVVSRAALINVPNPNNWQNKNLTANGIGATTSTTSSVGGGATAIIAIAPPTSTMTSGILNGDGSNTIKCDSPTLSENSNGNNLLSENGNNDSTESGDEGEGANAEDGGEAGGQGGAKNGNWKSRQPRECDICKRMFSNKFNLKQHVLNMHTEGRELTCELCMKKVKNKWYLRRHHVTHHGAPLKK